jgi:hypothetical protein
VFPTALLGRSGDSSPVPELPNGNGTLFGRALTPNGKGLYFVDDGTNTLNLFS